MPQVEIEIEYMLVVEVDEVGKCWVRGEWKKMKKWKLMKKAISSQHEYEHEYEYEYCHYDYDQCVFDL